MWKMKSTIYHSGHSFCVRCGVTVLVIGVSGTVLYMWIKKWFSGSCGSSDGDNAGVQGSSSTQQNSGLESRTPSPGPATPKTDDMKQTVTVLETMKTELENQMDDVKHQLEEVDEQKKKNKEKLQEVEKELKEREENYDIPEELLKEKEELLRTEWRLDKEKRIYEKQQSNLNKLMDPVETLVTRITRDPQWSS